MVEAIAGSSDAVWPADCSAPERPRPRQWVDGQLRRFTSHERARVTEERIDDPQVGRVSDELPALTVADGAAWLAWLQEHHGDDRGVWLTLARKGAAAPTSLTYDGALEEALCHGWIDGQIRVGDEYSYRQRFTPRTPRSAWSKRNVATAERLIAEGRMQESGLAAVERAKADGRWDAAYAGPASIEVLTDLAAALDSHPAARTMFQNLNSRNRCAVLYRIETAKRAETRSRRNEQFVATLARGETIYPQHREGPR